MGSLSDFYTSTVLPGLKQKKTLYAGQKAGNSFGHMHDEAQSLISKLSANEDKTHALLKVSPEDRDVGSVQKVLQEQRALRDHLEAMKRTSDSLDGDKMFAPPGELLDTSSALDRLREQQG